MVKTAAEAVPANETSANTAVLQMILGNRFI